LASVPIVGIIGGIGSGKSLVAAEFARLGGRLIAADQLGHEALRQGDVKRQVLERWGREVFDEKGEVQRRRLGQKVFADPKELRALEAIVFPWIGERIHAEIAAARQDAAVKLIVLDAAVMVEAGWDKNCDRVVFVDAPAEVRLKRLVEKRGWNEKEAREREKAQLPLDVKKQRADTVIDNAGAAEAVASQVQKLLRQWGIVG